MKLKARVFELCNGKYPNLVELAQAMEISQDLIYRVRKGERGIHERFIIGVLGQQRPFPDINLMTFSMSQRIS